MRATQPGRLHLRASIPAALHCRDRPRFQGDVLTFMTTTILPDRTEPTADAVAVQQPLLGELLVQSGKLSARDLERALSAQQEMGGLLGRVLVRLGLVSETDVIQALSRQLGIPLISANDFPDLMPEVEGLLPEFLQANSVYPLSVEDGRLHVAMAVPQDAFVVKALHLATGLSVVPRLALESDIEKALAEPVEQAGEEEGDDGFGDGADGATSSSTSRTSPARHPSSAWSMPSSAASSTCALRTSTWSPSTTACTYAIAWMASSSSANWCPRA